MTKRAWLTLFLLASCGAERDALSEHRELWAAKGPASYQYTFTSQGFSPPLQMQVTVTDGAVSSTTIVESSSPGPEGQTVEQLFSDVEKRLDSECDVNVSYEETLGYPLSVYSDCGQEGDGWATSEFSAL